MEKKFFSNIQKYIKENRIKKKENRTKKNVSLPTPEDLTGSEILELKEKLKGESDEETLTNILEWQDRNIEFWSERYPLALIVKPVFIFFIIFFILAQIIRPLTSIYVGFLGAIALIVVYLPLQYSHFLREKPIKEKISKFLRLVDNTFSLSLPVDNILEDKLAVCRDYAMLTASLLFNLYTNPAVYFIASPHHVAAGIKLKDEIYVLDQHLPVLTIDNYSDIYSLQRDSKGNITLKLEQPARTKKTNLVEIDTKELTEEVAKILKIKQSSLKDKPDFKITLEKFAKLYYYDEIIKYSLIRAFKNRIENEFCGNVHKISKVTIDQDKENFALKVYYESEVT